MWQFVNAKYFDFKWIAWKSSTTLIAICCVGLVFFVMLLAKHTGYIAIRRNEDVVLVNYTFVEIGAQIRRYVCLFWWNGFV